MQVSVETTSNIERRMTIGVPAQEIDQAVQKRPGNYNAPPPGLAKCAFEGTPGIFQFKRSGSGSPACIRYRKRIE